MSSRFILPFADVGRGLAIPSGAKLFFFKTDGVTPKDTFSDQLSTPTPNANPVIANSNGVFGDIYISGSYKVDLQNKNGTQIFGGAIVDEFVTGSGQAENVLSRDTLAIAVADTSLSGGLSINLKERTTGNGGGAMWDVVLASSVTPNTVDIIQCVGVPTLALVLRVESASVDAKPFGIDESFTAAQNGAALEAAINRTPTGGTLLIPSGKFLTDRQISANGKSVKGAGKGVTILDATGQSNASSEFGAGTVAAVIDCKGGTYTQIANLSGNLTKGTKTVPFAAAHGLVVGDLFIIYDDNNGSYSLARDSYKSGQYCEVASVVSTTEVLIQSYIYIDYASATCDVYRADLTSNSISDITVIAPGVGQGLTASIVDAVICRDLRETDCSNIGAFNSNDISMFVFNCYKVTGTGITAVQDTETSEVGVINTQYGLAITNSLFCEFEGNFTGYRHAIDYSAGANFFNITTRFCSVHGKYENMDVSGQTIAVLKFHGNTEYCKFTGEFTGTAGISFSGNKNKVNCKGVVDASQDGLLVHFGELTGLDFELLGEYEVLGDPLQDANWGIIDAGTISGFGIEDNIGASRVEDGYLLKFGFTLKAPNATGQIFRIFNKTGPTLTGDWRIDFTGFSAYAPNLTPAPNGSTFYDIRVLSGGSTALIKGLKEQGDYSVTTNTANNLEQLQIDYAIGFPKTPRVDLTQIDFTTEGSGVGDDRLVVWLSSPDLANFDVIIGTTQATNFTSIGAKTGIYNATLEEF